MHTKEAWLNWMALCYASQCLAEGDTEVLLEMGFERGDLERLRQLTQEDALRLSRFGGTLLRVTVDRAMFHRLLCHIQHEREIEALQDRMMAQDAPLALLSALFGCTSAEYASRRKRLGITSGVGRPSEVDEATELKVWAASRGLSTDADRLSPAQWLALAEDTGVPLRSVWTLVQRWDLSGRPDPREPFRREDIQVVTARASPP